MKPTTNKTIIEKAIEKYDEPCFAIYKNKNGSISIARTELNSELGQMFTRAYEQDNDLLTFFEITLLIYNQLQT